MPVGYPVMAHRDRLRPNPTAVGDPRYDGDDAIAGALRA
jgi:hypothetical protein